MFCQSKSFMGKPRGHLCESLETERNMIRSLRELEYMYYIHEQKKNTGGLVKAINEMHFRAFITH